MVNATISDEIYTFVIDTGSADTWVASSNFKCENPYTRSLVSLDRCGFGPLYDIGGGSFQPVNYPFAVNYSGGEFLRGDMGTERFSFEGGKSINLNQMIGVVDEGYWMGDGISSGLMGLGFPALARGIITKDLNYTSVLYTM
jgi:hypothetical protein